MVGHVPCARHRDFREERYPGPSLEEPKPCGGEEPADRWLAHYCSCHWMSGALTLHVADLMTSHNDPWEFPAGLLRDWSSWLSASLTSTIHHPAVSSSDACSFDRLLSENCFKGASLPSRLTPGSFVWHLWLFSSDLPNLNSQLWEWSPGPALLHHKGTGTHTHKHACTRVLARMITCAHRQALTCTHSHTWFSLVSSITNILSTLQVFALGLLS